MNRNTRLLLAVVGLGLAGAALMAVSGWLTSERERQLALRTMQLAVGSCLIALPLGGLIGWLLEKADPPGKRIYWALLSAMLFSPLYLQAAGWDAGFGLQGWLQTTSGELTAPPLLAGMRAAIWIHALAAAPWVALIISISLRDVEPELEEAAELDAGVAAAWLHVTLPRISGGIAAAALWVVVWTAGEITVADMYQVNTYSRAVYSGYALGDETIENARRAAPALLSTTWLTAAAMLIALRLAPPRGAPAERRSRPPRSASLRWGAAVVVALLVLLLVGVPLANLLYQAGVAVQQIGDERVRAWSLGKCLQIMVSSGPEYGPEFAATSLTALLAATAAVFVSLPLAWLARNGSWRAAPAVAAVSLCLATPGPLLGLALIWLLDRPDVPGFVWLYDRTLVPLAMVAAVKAIPIAVLILWRALATTPRDTLDQSAVDGARPSQTLFYVALPQRLSALALAWLAGVALSVGELSASVLVAPPGVNTLSIRIFGLIHYGVNDQVAGVCLVIFAAVFGLSLAAGWLAGRVFPGASSAGRG